MKSAGIKSTFYSRSFALLQCVKRNQFLNRHFLIKNSLTRLIWGYLMVCEYRDIIYKWEKEFHNLRKLHLKKKYQMGLFCT